jgi:hypothetical protein
VEVDWGMEVEEEVVKEDRGMEEEAVEEAEAVVHYRLYS